MPVSLFCKTYIAGNISGKADCLRQITVNRPQETQIIHAVDQPKIRKLRDRIDQFRIDFSSDSEFQRIVLSGKTG